MTDAPVLIVGAGPTGLALALWLAKAGVPFRLVDRKPAPGEGSRAIIVQARTLEFYRQLGVAADAIAAGFRVDRLHLRNKSGEIATVVLGEVGKDESPYPFALSLPQDDHERFLTEQLQKLGHRVEWNTELTRFTQDDGGVRAVLRQADAEAAWAGAYLCGCDGAHSAVRHGMGVGFPGGTYDQLFYVADAEAEGAWTTHEFAGYLAEKTFCLCFPVRAAGMFRFIGLVPESLRGRDDVKFEEFRAEVEQVTGTRITRVNWFSTYRVSHRVADHFRQGRVFLAGDAGHVHSPAGGQGMNTGIGDAVNLAWKLAAVLGGKSAVRLLDSYEAERLPFAQLLVETTDRVFEGVIGRGFLARTIRTVFAPFVLPWALRFAAVRRAQFRLISQTRINYRKSPLSRGTVGKVHAGDRLPWVDESDNFEPLKSLGWQIHVYGTATPGLREFATGAGVPLHEWPWTAAARRARLKKDAMYLVRPDGHVGLACGTQDVQELRKYLAETGNGHIAPGLPGAVRAAP